MNEGDQRAAIGWHTDRDDPLTTRYWDGTRWTDERRWNGTEWVAASIQPAVSESPWAPPADVAGVSPDSSATSVPPKRPFPTKVVAVVAAVVVVLVIIGVAFGGDDSGGNNSNPGGNGEEQAFSSLVVQHLEASGFPFEEACVRQNIHDEWSTIQNDIQDYMELNSLLSEAEVAAIVASTYYLGVPLDC